MEDGAGALVAAGLGTFVSAIVELAATDVGASSPREEHAAATTVVAVRRTNSTRRTNRVYPSDVERSVKATGLGGDGGAQEFEEGCVVLGGMLDAADVSP